MGMCFTPQPVSTVNYHSAPKFNYITSIDNIKYTRSSINICSNTHIFYKLIKRWMIGYNSPQCVVKNTCPITQY